MAVLLKNYVKITMRNIRKHKGYSFINFFGLFIGIACTILILLWIRYELSYDRFHENAGELYRVISNWKDGVRGTSCPGAAAKALRDEYPEIINSTRFHRIQNVKLTFQDTSLFGSGHYVDPSFFEMFSFPFLQGTSQTAFAQPRSIVLTENFARRIFGSGDPLGKTIMVDDGAIGISVTGVLRDIPPNSHIQSDFFIPAEIGRPRSMNVWNNNVPHIYVLLHKNIGFYQDVSQKISGLVQRYDPEADNILELQPLNQIHLYALEGGGRIGYLYAFTVMAIIILLIACINFMNLTTARSAQRIKEIGVRKVVGSTRLQLMAQFLTESIFISLAAFGSAAIIVSQSFPFISSLLGQNIQVEYSLSLVLSLIGIALLTGIISGSYPAFLLSSYGPVHMLKKELPLLLLLNRKKAAGKTAGARKSGFRRILVVFQFSLSIGLTVCALTVYSQLDYMSKKDLGFNKEHVIVLETQREFRQKFKTVKNELLKDSNILSVTGTDPHPVIQYGETARTNWEGRAENALMVTRLKWVDYDFLETFDIELAAGRFFSKRFPADAKNAFVINEKAAQAMGLTDPLGKQYSLLFSSGEQTGIIIGVVKNFHNEPLHDEVRPLTLILDSRARFYYMSLRIKAETTDILGTINVIENKISEIVPSYLFRYKFLDEEIHNLYQSERIIQRLVVWATALAIFISCLGLLGLISFTSEQRTKEIGIRKVLGASASEIVLLLSQDLAKWVLMANLFSWPLAWYALNKWLQNFAYHKDISGWTFLLAGALALVIALLSVSYQAFRAAVANPVKSLRYE